LKSTGYLILAVIVVGISLLPYIHGVYGQGSLLNIDQKIFIEKNGGNLYLFYQVEIIGDNPGSVVFNFPVSFIDGSRYFYVEAYYGKKNLIPVSIEYHPNATSINIDVSGLPLVDNKYSFSFILYIPAYVYQESAGSYSFDIVRYPSTNIPINYTKLEIDLPFDTRPDTNPPGTEVIRVSPTGAPQDQYKIEGEFGANDIVYDSSGLPEVFQVSIRPTRGVAPPILLLKGNATLDIYLMSNGGVEYRLAYRLYNYGRDALAGNVRLEFKKVPGTRLVSALSMLNRELEATEVGDQVRVALPYATKPGEYIEVVLVLFDGDGAGLMGVVGDTIGFNASFSFPAEYFLEGLDINVFSPDNKLVYTDELSNVTKFSAVDINLKVGNNILGILGQVPVIGIPILVVGILGISYSIYNLVTYYLMGRLPPDLSVYLGKVSKFIGTMNELIELEDRYLAREIRSKEYVARRNELIRRLRSEIREANESKVVLKRRVGQNPVIERELRLVEEALDKWDELKRLESEFKARKVSPQEYSERRKRLILDFKSIVSKISI